jgi:hypothetical protein
MFDTDRHHEEDPDREPRREPNFPKPQHEPRHPSHDPLPDQYPGKRVGSPDSDVREPNPPHTTEGGMTSPKFGSAGSGGAELEPGPERP